MEGIDQGKPADRRLRKEPTLAPHQLPDRAVLSLESHGSHPLFPVVNADKNASHDKHSGDAGKKKPPAAAEAPIEAHDCA